MRAGRPGQGPRGTRGREAAMGVTIFSGGVLAWVQDAALKAGKNGGAPSSLTRVTGPHQTWPFVREK